MDLLIQDATILTMNPAREVLSGDVLVSEGRISAIGKAPKKVGSVRSVVNARGKLLIPGLVQAHVHLCQTLFRNRADGLELLDWLRERIWPFEAAHDERSLRASADLGIAELLLSGTTAILDMGTVRHTDVLFEAAREWGIRYVGGKAMMDSGQALPAGLRETSRSSVDESVRLAKAWNGQEDGRLRYAFAPRFVLSCTEELLRETAKQSQALGCRIHTHASENQSECEAVRQRVGSDNVDYFHRLGLLGKTTALAHGVWLTAHEQKLIAETGTSVVHCPSSNLKLASGVAKVPELASLGVQWALGCDGAPCNNNLDIFTEMRLASLLPKPRLGPAAMSPQAILEMATLGGARALGLESEIGSIELGKQADLVLLDLERPSSSPAGGDPYGRVVYSATSRNVDSVWVGGRAVVRKGELTEADGLEISRRAEVEAHRITTALD